MKIPKLEYQIYYPFYNNSNNMTKLNLSFCQDEKIIISIKVAINETIDKHNASSRYYNDPCYETKSEDGIDLSLKDRRDLFIINNMTLCEENCDLTDYVKNKTRAICSCDLKTNITSNINDIKFNKNEFLKSFIKINNLANISILKCYKSVLKIKSLINNYGFYIISFIIIIYLINLFAFFCIGYRKLIKDINNIIMIRKTDKTKEIKETKKEKDRKKDDSIIRNKNKKKERHKKHMKTKETKIDDENGYKKHNELNLNKKNKHKDKHKKSNKEVLQQTTKNKEDKSIKSMNKNTFDSIIKSGNYLKELMEQKDFEINSLDYEDAIKLDHRNFFEYYISLIKNNHPILFSFASYKDYNIRIIKVFLFFFSFSLDLSINALFFDDNTMHKIYIDGGSFNFIYNIPQILYSSLIAGFINALIKNLALSESDFTQLRQNKDKDKNNIKKKQRKY